MAAFVAEATVEPSAKRARRQSRGEAAPEAGSTGTAIVHRRLRRQPVPHARAEVRERGAKVGELIAGATAGAAGGMSAAGASIMAMLLEPSSKERTQMRSWTRAALAMNDDPCPVTAEKAIAFAGYYVTALGNMSSSLKQVFSQLKAAVLRQWGADCWLDAGDAQQLSRAVKKLQRCLPATSQHAEALYAVDIKRLQDGPLAEPLAAGDIWALQFNALMLLLYQTMSRGDDLLNGHLLWAHVESSSEGIALTLPLDKTHKSVMDDRRNTTYAIYLVGQLCAASAMDRYRSALPADRKKPSDPVFPRIARNGCLASGPLTSKTFLKALRTRLMGPAGYSEEQQMLYGWHSFRSGGETDHEDDGWPEGLRAAIGRWAYAASQRRYNRSGPRMFKLLRKYSSSAAV